MTAITAEVTGNLTGLRGRMAQWRRRVEGSLLNRVAQRVAKQTRDRIRSEKRSPDGRPWAPRKDSSKTHPLLQGSRKMERSIKAARDSRTLIKVGSPIGYDAFLHHGTRKMVAREIYGLSTDNIDDIEALINSWVERNLR